MTTEEPANIGTDISEVEPGADHPQQNKAIDSGDWPTRRTETIDWLIEESRNQPFVDDIFGELCPRLLKSGIPLKRATMHLRTLHPQFMGATIEWREGWGESRFTPHAHANLSSDAYRNSPVRVLFEEADGLRQRLDVGGELEFGIYRSLRDQGYTDYVGIPLLGTNNQRSASSWVTDVPGGFSTDDLKQLYDLMPLLSMIAEIRINRRIAKNLLNTYVGRYAGERILAGEITRGSGATLRAAIWTCDMRGFSSLSERFGRDNLINCLNDFFDVMAEPVEEHGGEILKFIGDAMLAVFPLEHPSACNRAFEAGLAAIEGMRKLNEDRVANQLIAIDFGIALHVGDVMYGNIGARKRLDFTVIGPAVNTASRLEDLNKKLRRHIVVSKDFVELCDQSKTKLQSIGHFELKGVSHKVEAYGLVDEIGLENKTGQAAESEVAETELADQTGQATDRP